MTLGIFLPCRLGDLVMATPMLRAVRRHLGPEARLVGITPRHLSRVLGGTAWLDEQWCYSLPNSRRGSGDWRLARRMHEARFDTVLFLNASFRAHTLAWLAGAKQRVGYARHGQGSLLTHRLDRPRCGRSGSHSMVDHYLRLAEVIGCPSDSIELELATVERDEESAERIWQDLGLRVDERIVLLNPSGEGSSAKLWPPAYFGELSRRVATELDHDVLVLCGYQNRAVAEEIARSADHPRVFSLADQSVNLGVIKACIRRGRLMVSGDSGLRFIAGAFGKPVIALFGPTMPDCREAPTMHSINLYVHLSCIGCQNRICPLRHHRCMADLPVDMVFSEVARLMQESLAACAA